MPSSFFVHAFFTSAYSDVKSRLSLTTFPAARVLNKWVFFQGEQKVEEHLFGKSNIGLSAFMRDVAVSTSTVSQRGEGPDENLFPFGFASSR